MQNAKDSHSFSGQQCPDRAYAELLQADMMSAEHANLIIDCMRAYGANSIGVVANVGLPDSGDRAILGFISYGYAQMLLRLDRIEEYMLFLYAHRFHDHNPGSWTAGEVAGIDGSATLFCIPAQLAIPLLVRWMLVAEFAAPSRSKQKPRFILVALSLAPGSQVGNSSGLKMCPRNEEWSASQRASMRKEGPYTRQLN